MSPFAALARCAGLHNVMLLHRRRQRLRCHWECWGRNLLLDDDWGRDVDRWHVHHDLRDRSYDRADGLLYLRSHIIADETLVERDAAFLRVLVEDEDFAARETVRGLFSFGLPMSSPICYID